MLKDYVAAFIFPLFCVQHCDLVIKFLINLLFLTFFHLFSKKISIFTVLVMINMSIFPSYSVSHPGIMSG